MMFSFNFLFLIYLVINGNVIDYCAADLKFELDHNQAQVNRTKRQSGNGKFRFLRSRIDKYRFLKKSLPAQTVFFFLKH